MGGKKEITAYQINKEITAYQINNVLRVYGEQLRRGRISNRMKPTNTNSPDKISISIRTRRKTIIDDTTSKPNKT
jgi:16S rRNA C1402 N4-methylase RsmH